MSLPETLIVSRDSKNSPDSTDRKKATHLRCERQRREAINVCLFYLILEC